MCHIGAAFALHLLISSGMCICYGILLPPNRMEFRKRVKKIHYIDYIECLESDNLHENFAKTRVFDLVAMDDAKPSSERRHCANMQMHYFAAAGKKMNCLGVCMKLSVRAML